MWSTLQTLSSRGRHAEAHWCNRGAAEAVIIPYEDWVRCQDLQEQATLAHVDRLQCRMATENAQYSEDEVAADVEAARSDA